MEDIFVTFVNATLEDTTSSFGNATKAVQTTASGTNLTSITTELTGSAGNKGSGATETWLTFLSYITLPAFLVVGLCGNSLTIMVTTGRQYRKSSHSLYLTAMAIADIIFLFAFTLTKTSTHDLFGLDVRAMSVSGCKFFYFFFRVSRTMSSSLVVLICVERFIVVWFPLRAKLISTRRAAAIAIFSAFIVCMTISGIRTVVVGVKHDKCYPFVMTPYNKQMKEACSAIGMVLRTLIPAVTLMLLTPLIVGKLFHQRYLRRKMSGLNHTDETFHVTLMLTSVIVAFYILIMPFCLFKHALLYAGINIASSPLTWARNVNEIQQICEQTNCVINFILYVMLSASFRRHFCALIYCRGEKGKQDSMKKKSTIVRTMSTRCT